MLMIRMWWDVPDDIKKYIQTNLIKGIINIPDDAVFGFFDNGEFSVRDVDTEEVIISGYLDKKFIKKYFGGEKDG